MLRASSRRSTEHLARGSLCPELPGRGPVPVPTSCAAGAGGAQHTSLTSTPGNYTRSFVLVFSVFPFQPLQEAVERSRATPASNRGCDPGHILPFPSRLSFSPRTLSPREDVRVHRYRQGDAVPVQCNSRSFTHDRTVQTQIHPDPVPC